MKICNILLSLSVLLLSSCANYGPFYVDKRYGAPVSYAEGIHPGIDFDIARGTPIIAASDGEVIHVNEPCPQEKYCGGLFVMVRHGNHFKSLYGHLIKVFVKAGQSLKRGELIGLSGASNIGNVHLHFGICKMEGNCINYSQTYNPDKFWLGGRPQCFDPSLDYSRYSQKEITLPVACGKYADELIAESKKKD